jgi:hypothetical protein
MEHFELIHPVIVLASIIPFRINLLLMQESLSLSKTRSRWHDNLTGWLASLTLGEEDRMELRSPRTVCEYADVFPDALPRLPPTRELDFTI